MQHDQRADIALMARPSKRAPSLTETVYAQLRAEIITCQLSPGADISEMDLADRFGISKTPIREALGRLDQEGFVETFPRRGYRIRPVTMKDINDLFAVRRVLEQTAAGLAAQNMTDAEFDRLDALAGASYTIGEAHSMTHFVESNRMFHCAIAEASLNTRLCSLVISHLEESERFFYIGARSRDVNVETNQDHAGIVAVLRQRDVAAACHIMAEHIENTRRGLNASILNGSSAEISL